MLSVPSPAQAAAAVDGVRRVYSRMLSAWAMDVLVLRRGGGDRLVWRSAACAAPHDEGGEHPAMRKAA